MISRQGRDNGHSYVVVRVYDGRFVGVADGQLRTVARPKKKNCRHLTFTPYRAQHLSARLEQGERVEDSEIRVALQALDRDQRGLGDHGEG